MSAKTGLGNIRSRISNHRQLSAEYRSYIKTADPLTRLERDEFRAYKASGTLPERVQPPQLIADQIKKASDALARAELAGGLLTDEFRREMFIGSARHVLDRSWRSFIDAAFFIKRARDLAIDNDLVIPEELEGLTSRALFAMRHLKTAPRPSSWDVLNGATAQYDLLTLLSDPFAR